MLQDYAGKRFLQELDLPNCEIFPDSQVSGVWGVDSHRTGIRVIVYLAGYRDQYGEKRQYNDFEDGDIPERERKQPTLDLYKLSDKPEDLIGYQQHDDIFRINKK